MVIEYKAYLTAKDVMKLIDCGRTTAYEIVRDLRNEKVNGVPWKDTYESKMKKGKVIPTSIFIKKFPSCKGSIKKRSLTDTDQS